MKVHRCRMMLLVTFVYCYSAVFKGILEVLRMKFWFLLQQTQLCFICICASVSTHTFSFHLFYDIMTDIIIEKTKNKMKYNRTKELPTIFLYSFLNHFTSFWTLRVFLKIVNTYGYILYTYFFTHPIS